MYNSPKIVSEIYIYTFHIISKKKKKKGKRGCEGALIAYLGSLLRTEYTIPYHTHPYSTYCIYP